MSLDDLKAIMGELDLTAPIVATSYDKIIDEEGDCLLRECQ